LELLCYKINSIIKKLIDNVFEDTLQKFKKKKKKRKGPDLLIKYIFFLISNFSNLFDYHFFFF